jgi:uncharacterized protein (TIGR02300 family)
LANPELGAKQICPSCSTKFYDLGRRPAHCPKCQAEFDPEEALRSRRVRSRAPLPEDDTEEEKPKVADESEDGLEAEPDDTKELDAAIEDAPLISDDDDDAVDPDAAPTAPGVDFAEDEDLEAADDDEVPFIEDEDEDDSFPDDDIEGLDPENADDH